MLALENPAFQTALDQLERAFNGRVFMYPIAEMCIELFRLSAVSEIRDQIWDDPRTLAQELDLPTEPVQPRISPFDDQLFFDRHDRLCVSLDEADGIVDYYVNTAVRRIEDAYDTRIPPEHRGYIPHDLYGDRYGGSVKDYVVVGELNAATYPGDATDRRALLLDPVMYTEMDGERVVLPESVTLGAMTVIARQRDYLLPRRVREKQFQYMQPSWAS